MAKVTGGTEWNISLVYRYYIQMTLNFYFLTLQPILEWK